MTISSGHALAVATASGRGASHSSGSQVTTNSRSASAILACAGARPSHLAVSSSSLVSVSGGLASRARTSPGRPASRAAFVSVIAIEDSGTERPADRILKLRHMADRDLEPLLGQPGPDDLKPGRDNGVMASPLAGLPDELAGHQVRPGAASPVLPNGPRYPRIVQAWLWLKKPTWFLDRCSRTYGDVFTMRLPLGIDLVHIARPELVKAVFGGDNDVLRAGEANATILEPLVGPHSVLVLDGPEHLRQRKLILPAFHGDRMRAWESSVREITRAEIARWPVGKPFALRASMQSITLDVIVRVVFGVDGSARGDELRGRIRTL